MKRILSAVFFAALPLLLKAQAVTPETFRDDPDKSGGIYYVYHYGESDEDGVPRLRPQQRDFPPRNQ